MNSTFGTKTIYFLPNAESTCNIHVQYANDRTCSQWGKLFSNNGKQEEGKYAQYGVVLSFLQLQHNVVSNYGNASDSKDEAGTKSLNQYIG